MRLPTLAVVFALTAAPALAQQSTPRQMMEQLGVAPPAGQVARAVERARGQPLGTAANPVRVSGARAEHAYIGRLRCADGNMPRVGQRRNDGVGAFGTIVDVWPLDCGDAAPGRFSLFMDMYHDDHEEQQAPTGFTLVPAEGGATTGKPAAPPDPAV